MVLTAVIRRPRNNKSMDRRFYKMIAKSLSYLKGMSKRMDGGKPRMSRHGLDVAESVYRGVYEMRI